MPSELLCVTRSLQVEDQEEGYLLTQPVRGEHTGQLLSPYPRPSPDPRASDQFNYSSCIHLLPHPSKLKHIYPSPESPAPPGLAKPVMRDRCRYFLWMLLPLPASVLQSLRGVAAASSPVVCRQRCSRRQQTARRWCTWSQRSTTATGPAAAAHSSLELPRPG